jgi:hypothetical protein
MRPPGLHAVSAAWLTDNGSQDHAPGSTKPVFMNTWTPHSSVFSFTQSV